MKGLAFLSASFLFAIIPLSCSGLSIQPRQSSYGSDSGSAPITSTVSKDGTCKPTSYAIEEYIFGSFTGNSYINFNLALSGLPNGTVTCHGSASSNAALLGQNFQCSEFESKAGSIVFSLVGNVGDPEKDGFGDFVLEHDVACEGNEWISVTQVKPTGLEYISAADDQYTCVADSTIMVEAQNVREICGTPTC